MISILATAAVFAVAPSGAGAATVRLGDDLEIEATPGEVNNVTVGSGPGSSFLIEDATSPLTAGPGCAAAGSAVSCAFSGSPSVFVNLGDGNDRLQTSGTLPGEIRGEAGDGNDVISLGEADQACFAGGEGDDTLSVLSPTLSCSIDGDGGDDRLFGSGGQDRLYGGSGTDVLDGGPGDDYAEGGDGDDLIDGGPGSDVFLEGGEGNDTVQGGLGNDFMDEGPGEDSYTGGSGGDALGVLPSAGTDDDSFVGGPGLDGIYIVCGGCQVHPGTKRNGRRHSSERDYLEIENVVIRSLIPNDEELPPERFGTGADIVVGTQGSNVLRTERGPDRIVARAGSDTIKAGTQNDFIDAADGHHDALVDCGKGDDRAIVDRFDRPKNCERVQVLGPH